jgi:hypothetical protein
MRTTLSLTLLLTACLSTSPDDAVNTPDADASVDEIDNLHLAGGRGGSSPDAPDSSVPPDGSVPPPPDGGVPPDGSVPPDADVPPDSSVPQDGGGFSACTLFADTFNRPNGSVGDAEHPSGVTWKEREKAVTLPDGGVGWESSEYAIEDGELAVGLQKGTYFDAVLPGSRSSGDGTRLRFAGRVGPDGLNVNFLVGGNTPTVDVWLKTDELRASYKAVFTADPETEYFVEALVQGDTIFATAGVDGYVSEGGTEVAKTPVATGLYFGPYDRVSIFLRDGATLDEVFVEKYPCP